MEKVEAVCRFICQNLQPHLTLYLDVDPQIGLMRVKKSRSQDRIEAEDFSFHVKIRECYLAIHKKDPKRFHLLNAAASPNEICQQAMAVLIPVIKNKI